VFCQAPAKKHFIQNGNANIRHERDLPFNLPNANQAEASTLPVNEKIGIGESQLPNQGINTLPSETNAAIGESQLPNQGTTTLPIETIGESQLPIANRIGTTVSANAQLPFKIQLNYHIDPNHKSTRATRQPSRRFNGASREDAQVNASLFFLEHQREHYFADACIHHYLFRQPSRADVLGYPSNPLRAIFCARHVVGAPHRPIRGLNGSSSSQVAAAMCQTVTDTPRIGVFDSPAPLTAPADATIQHLIQLFWSDFTKSIAILVHAISGNAQTHWIVISLHHQTASSRPVVVHIHDTLSNDEFFDTFPPIFQL
jgi:hypothetical protein